MRLLILQNRTQGLCNIRYPPEAHLYSKSRETFTITYFSVIQIVSKSLHGAWQCSVQKMKNDRMTQSDVMDERDFARFEFRMSFGGYPSLHNTTIGVALSSLGPFIGVQAEWLETIILFIVYGASVVFISRNLLLSRCPISYNYTNLISQIPRNRKYQTMRFTVLNAYIHLEVNTGTHLCSTKSCIKENKT